MTTSVALCTYNGIEFLAKQLDSIIRQTKPVDEIIICDDCSTDSTCNMVRQYIKECPIRIRLIVNPVNIGYVFNFEQAISLCSGDIIFLSDQDDIWMLHKVETICRFFEAHEDKEFVFTDAELVNSWDVKSFDKTLFQAVGLDKVNKKIFDNGCPYDVLGIFSRITGATIAFRSSFLPYCVPFPVTQTPIVHDEIMGISAMLHHKIARMDECLIKYRLHDKQTVLESVNLYVATMDFLAGRYSRQDKLYGHIHRWIVHNEVDTAWTWCNAGKKRDTELMELYVKSMRLIYYTTFRYNANTEVFISLAHNWRSSFNQNCYFGATMLDLLLVYSNAEGDFRWGVAYHPYPELLSEPKSWLDPNASDDFNTKLITFKNVELLDKWIKQPRTFYRQTAQRTMALTEQNPNSFDYTPQSLLEQADSLRYVLEKVKKCSGIEAYIAHSWIDARFEAGLKTGLRKYLDDPDDPGGKKPAWYVFKSQ